MSYESAYLEVVSSGLRFDRRRKRPKKVRCKPGFILRGAACQPLSLRKNKIRNQKKSKKKRKNKKTAVLTAAALGAAALGTTSGGYLKFKKDYRKNFSNSGEVAKDLSFQLENNLRKEAAIRTGKSPEDLTPEEIFIDEKPVKWNDDGTVKKTVPYGVNLDRKNIAFTIGGLHDYGELGYGLANQVQGDLPEHSVIPLVNKKVQISPEMTWLPLNDMLDPTLDPDPQGGEVERGFIARRGFDAAMTKIVGEKKWANFRDNTLRKSSAYKEIEPVARQVIRNAHDLKMYAGNAIKSRSHADAIDAAAYAMAYKRNFPDKQIDFIAHSGGGVAGAEALEILKTQNIKARLVSVASPHFGLTDLPEEQLKTIGSREDYMTKAPMQNFKEIPEKTAHVWVVDPSGESYKNGERGYGQVDSTYEEIRAFFYGEKLRTREAASVRRKQAARERKRLQSLISRSRKKRTDSIKLRTRSKKLNCKPGYEQRGAACQKPSQKRSRVAPGVIGGAVVGLSAYGISHVDIKKAAQNYRKVAVPEGARQALEKAKSIDRDKIPEFKNKEQIIFTQPGFTNIGGRNRAKAGETQFAQTLQDSLGSRVAVVPLSNDKFNVKQSSEIEDLPFDISSKTLQDPKLSNIQKAKVASQFFSDGVKQVFSPLLKKKPEPNAQAVESAARMYAYAQKNPDKPIRIVGHSAGSMVSRDVVDYLIEMGIPPEKIKGATLGGVDFNTSDSTNTINIGSRNDPVVGKLPNAKAKYFDDIKSHDINDYMKHSGVMSDIAQHFGLTDRQKRKDAKARPKKLNCRPGYIQRGAACQPIEGQYSINPKTKQEYTIRELKQVASARGVYRYSEMNKSQLKQVLEATDADPQQQKRLSKTFSKDRSRAGNISRVLGSTARTKPGKALVGSARTWNNIRSVAKFAGANPRWGALAVTAFVSGSSIKQYQGIREEHRKQYREAAENALQRAEKIDTGSRKVGKQNITFIVGGDKNEGHSGKEIKQELDKNPAISKASETIEVEAKETKFSKNPFPKKIGNFGNPAHAAFSAVNHLGNYAKNYQRKHNEDAVELAAQVYAYANRRDTQGRLSHADKPLNILTAGAGTQTVNDALEILKRMPGERSKRGNESGKDVLERINVASLGGANLGFTDDVAGSYQTFATQNDPYSILPKRKPRWVSSVSGSTAKEYLENEEVLDRLQEMFQIKKNTVSNRRKPTSRRRKDSILSGLRLDKKRGWFKGKKLKCAPGFKQQGAVCKPVTPAAKKAQRKAQRKATVQATLGATILGAAVGSEAALYRQTKRMRKEAEEYAAQQGERYKQARNEQREYWRRSYQRAQQDERNKANAESSWHQSLGLDPPPKSATKEEKRAYGKKVRQQVRKLQKEYHPDLQPPEKRKESEKKSKEVNIAFAKAKEQGYFDSFWAKHYSDLGFLHMDEYTEAYFEAISSPAVVYRLDRRGGRRGKMKKKCKPGYEQRGAACQPMKRGGQGKSLAAGLVAGAAVGGIGLAAANPKVRSKVKAGVRKGREELEERFPEQVEKARKAKAGVARGAGKVRNKARTAKANTARKAGELRERAVNSKAGQASRKAKAGVARGAGKVRDKATSKVNQAVDRVTEEIDRRGVEFLERREQKRSNR